MPRTRVLLSGCLLFCFPILFAACSEIPIVPISAPTPEPVQAAAGPGAFDPKEMVLIPAGPFQMGCSPKDTVCASDEKPLHTVTLSAYAIDIHEVTNARYAACVASGGCTAPNSTLAYSYGGGSGHYYDYYGAAQYANFPVIHVTLHQAKDFCEWADKRLPTEAEWEKAARGSSDTRIYPWGNDSPNCTLANFYNVAARKYCVGEMTAVGSYPAGASPYGVMDMSGNVMEWVSDWYQEDYYAIPPVNDPQGPGTGDSRVARGGAWSGNGTVIRASYRSDTYLGSLYRDTGFRCAFSQ